jgi:putative FmdB family regulatory protein
MDENMYLCRQCGHLFRGSVDEVPTQKKQGACPQCGGSQIRELPSWEPLGSELSDVSLSWEYQCQECRHQFSLPVPASPSQEKDIKCPECNGGHIHRLTRSGFEPLYCG